VHLDGGITDTQLVESKEFREVYYECAWRGLRWNINEIIDPESNVSDVFNRDIYKCLKALVQGDASQFWDTFERSRMDVMKSLGLPTKLYMNLSRLQMFSELLDAWKILWEKDGKMNTSMHIPTEAEITWKGGIQELAEHTFEYVEPILALRGVLFKVMGREDLITNHICDVAHLARKESRFQLASSLIKSLSLGKKDPSSWLLEEAKLLWKQGE